MVDSRWILDTATKKIHDKKGLTELCNTDDILPKNREEVDDVTESIRSGYEFCKHCSE